MQISICQSPRKPIDVDPHLANRRCIEFSKKNKPTTKSLCAQIRWQTSKTKSDRFDIFSFLWWPLHTNYLDTDRISLLSSLPTVNTTRLRGGLWSLILSWTLDRVHWEVGRVRDVRVLPARVNWELRQPAHPSSRRSRTRSCVSLSVSQCRHRRPGDQNRFSAWIRRWDVSER